MSMMKTIGGDRLGTGKKMQVKLKAYERSTHDLGHLWRSTMSAGTLVPFHTLLALPGDTYDIDLNAEILTHPTIGPLFGSFKVQLDYFMTPIRLYQGQLHNNKIGIGMIMNQINLPILEMEAPESNNSNNSDNDQINPSSIFSYLGIRGLGRGINPKRTFNAIPYLAYYDIYKNYYANKQELSGAFIHREPVEIVKTITSVTTTTPTQTILEAPAYGIRSFTRQSRLVLNFTGTPVPIPNQIILNTNKGEFRLNELFINFAFAAGTISCSELLFRIDEIYNWRYALPTEVNTESPKVVMFPLIQIDEMRENILAATKVESAFKINKTSIMPFGSPMKNTGGIFAQLQSQEGLAIKTYQSDLFNNWINQEWMDGTAGVNEITAVDTSSGSFNIDTLNLSMKVYDMLNRIAVSGGSYDDWQDAVYTHDRYRKCETPMYMGGLSKELIFQEVVSLAATDINDQPLGTLGGRGKLSGKHKGGKITIKVDEPSYIMGIISITPRLDYSQGNQWDVNLKTMDDFHKPALDQIGFQDTITDQMAWWDTILDAGIPTFKSAGKQPAWINYMTAVNVVKGNFAIQNNEMFMVLNRRYEQLGGSGITDLTTYIDPVKFNHIFAQTSIDAQNFWAQVSIDCTARRKMSAKIMPNL